jgi:hypothetical protein
MSEVTCATDLCQAGRVRGRPLRRAEIHRFLGSFSCTRIQARLVLIAVWLVMLTSPRDLPLLHPLGVV